MRVHSQAELRWRCRTCGQTFAATKGTPFYRLPTAVDLVPIVGPRLGHGCPIQAMVAAFGLDERTVGPGVPITPVGGMTVCAWPPLQEPAGSGRSTRQRWPQV